MILITNASEALNGSFSYIIKYISNGGCFIEIASAKFLKTQPIDSSKNCSFRSIMPDQVLNASNSLKQELHGFVNQGMNN